MPREAGEILCEGDIDELAVYLVEDGRYPSFWSGSIALLQAELMRVGRNAFRAHFNIAHSTADSDMVEVVAHRLLERTRRSRLARAAYRKPSLKPRRR